LAFHEVAPCAEYCYHKSKAHPLRQSERGFETGNYRGHAKSKKCTTYTTHP
jgi:hypothetical protein